MAGYTNKLTIKLHKLKFLGLKITQLSQSYLLNQFENRRKNKTKIIINKRKVGEELASERC